jgi:hypothetical protein
MAFNPFTNFRKYQKIWMAVILLLCMVTFVLCTGTRGDFMEAVLSWTRPKGTLTARIDGRKVYSSELYDLKQQRNIANEFMNKAKGRVLEVLDEFLKTDNLKKLETKITNPKEREEKIFRAQDLRQQFELSIGKEKRFFGTGVKLDELIEHKLWLMEADRLNVDFTEQSVFFLVRADLGGPEWFDDSLFGQAFSEVRYNHQNVTRAMLLACLKDEYRARSVQKALNYSPPDVPPLRAAFPRLAMTPGQVWEYYQEKRVEYSIGLLPLHVDDFVKQVRAPSELELKSFFEANKSNRYDPTSDKVGFEIPNRVKATWISADPASEFYKRASKLAVNLQALSPLNTPALGPLHAAARAVGKAGAAAKQFEDVVRGAYRTPGFTESGTNLVVIDYLVRKDAVVGAGMIAAALRADAHPLLGGLNVLPTRYALGLARHREEYDAAAREDLNSRAPVYAGLALLGTAHGGIAIPGAWDQLSLPPRYLPLSLTQGELVESIERGLASRWANANMQVLKRKLEEPTVNTSAAIERVLALHGQNMGLERSTTKDFFHRYNIHEAKELEPLYKAYLAYFDNINNIEGRATPESRLKDSDFWKLFFDGAETFSATSGRYQVKPWPPVVRIGPKFVQDARLHAAVPEMAAHPQFQYILRQVEGAEPGKAPTLSLFKDADRPFLFWRIAEEPPLLPDKLETVRERVETAWKFSKAREDELLPRARKIAEEIQKGSLPYALAMNEAMEKLKKELGLKREIIPLPEVAPLQPRHERFGGGRSYEPYSLPPGLIPLPREDTAKALLELYDLKKPLETGNKELDEINKALYADISSQKSPQGKYVQILTNKTRSVYYLAVVRNPPYVSPIDFRLATQSAFGPDLFYSTGQREAVKHLREALTQQLRQQYDVEIVDPEARKSFDSDVAS